MLKNNKTDLNFCPIGPTVGVQISWGEEIKLTTETWIKSKMFKYLSFGVGRVKENAQIKDY